jgi:hypothetical protein
VFAHLIKVSNTLITLRTIRIFIAVAIVQILVDLLKTHLYYLLFVGVRLAVKLDISAERSLKYLCYKVIVTNREENFMLAIYTNEHGDNMYDCSTPHFFKLDLQ